MIYSDFFLRRSSRRTRWSQLDSIWRLRMLFQSLFVFTIKGDGFCGRMIPSMLFLTLLGYRLGSSHTPAQLAPYMLVNRCLRAVV